MIASVRGASSANLRIVLPVAGFRLDAWNMSSAAIAGPTTSLSVRGTPSPRWVNKSPQSRMPVGLFIEDAGFASMWDMRCVQVANASVPAEVYRFTIGQHARCAIRHIIQRYHAADLPMHDLGVRCYSEPFIHRATLVGLVVAEGDPSQSLGWQNPFNRRTNVWEHPPLAGVKQKRLVCQH
jgi:hypothetical protein